MGHEHDLTRRALIRAGTTAGVAAMLGVSATGETVAVPNDDYETTTGASEPAYGIADPEQHYVETGYTLPEELGGGTESPTTFGEITWPGDQETGGTIKDVPIILILSPYNDIRSPQSAAESTTGILESGWLDHNVKHWGSTRFFDALPDEPAQTGEYTFGPVEAHGEAAGWFAVPGTDDDNRVVGQEQQP
jgi:hypothetical protein